MTFFSLDSVSNHLGFDEKGTKKTPTCHIDSPSIVDFQIGNIMEHQEFIQTYSKSPSTKPGLSRNQKHAPSRIGLVLVGFTWINHIGFWFFILGLL